MTEKIMTRKQHRKQNLPDIDEERYVATFKMIHYTHDTGSNGIRLEFEVPVYRFVIT